MTDATTGETPDTLRISADTMGHDFLAALLAELRSMPDHWARLNEQRQQQIIENLREKISKAIDHAITLITRCGSPAVRVDLKSVTVKDGLTATVAIPKDAMYRHALFDAVGQSVLLIMTDTERWTKRMDEIKAKGDQIDLFDADYDPNVDQPGYRRDMDRTATTTWEDLKKSLKSTPPPAESPSTEPPPPEATPDEPETIEHRILQEQLGQLGVALSLGALLEWSPEQITEARAWAQAYAENAEACKIERPDWLPKPDIEGDKT